MLQKLVDQKQLQTNRQLSLEEIQWLEQEAERQTRNINLNKACLCFQAFIFNEIDEQFVEICDAVYSNPIRNKIKRRLVKNLRIKSIVPCQGSVAGGMQTVILCDSVDTSMNYYSNNII